MDHPEIYGTPQEPIAPDVQFQMKRKWAIEHKLGRFGKMPEEELRALINNINSNATAIQVAFPSSSDGEGGEGESEMPAEDEAAAEAVPDHSAQFVPKLRRIKQTRVHEVLGR